MKPTEFGSLVKVQEADGGIVTDIGVVASNHDSTLLVPAVERHIDVFGKAPIMVATDRGFFSFDGERVIQALGVRRPVIPHSGYRSRQRIAHERQRWFLEARPVDLGDQPTITIGFADEEASTTRHVPGRSAHCTIPLSPTAAGRAARETSMGRREPAPR